MNISNKLLAPAILLSCMVSACSSSSGVTPSTADAGAGSNASTEGSDTTGTSAAGTTMNGATDGDTEIEGAAPVSILQGNWATDCVIDEELFGTPYIQQSLSVNGANITTGFALFSDPDCTLPEENILLLNGTSVQTNGVTVPTGETVNVQQGAAVAVDWFLDEPTVDNAPLPDAFRGLEGFVPEVIYDIVYVSPEDRLFFGDTDQAGRDGTTAEQRPNSLDTRFSFGRLP